MTQQTMTKEQTAVEWIADRFRQYQKEGYKSNWDEVIKTVLLAKEIEDKELSKEREKAKKLVDGIKPFLDGIEIIDTMCGYHMCVPPAEIALQAKQSLSEYSQP